MASNLETLLLRETISPNYQTKGSTLSYAELDENLILLADIIRENIVNITPGGTAPYDPGKEYGLSGGDEYVTYGGNLWLYVFPTPSSGNTPASGSSYWSLQSTGALSHQQNTDTGTTSNSFGIGDGTDSDKTVFAANGDTNPPRIRYKASTNTWQYTNDGTTYIDFVDSVAINAALDLKLNIADYNDRFKGKFTSIGALMTAYPTANPGDYAQVDGGPGSDVANFNWDDEEGWVSGSGGSGASDTDALPEGATNLYFTTARVLATALTGLNTALTGSPISTDTILAAFGKVSNFISNIYSSAHTWAAAQTFSTAPVFSSVTASQTLEVDASKNLISAAKNTAYNVDFASDSDAATGTVTNKPVTPDHLRQAIWRIATANISGSVSIDLATGPLFNLTQTANVTAFTFTNAVVGKTYAFRITRTSNYTFTPTPTKWEGHNGAFLGLTDPAAVGGTSVDIIVAQCWSTGVLTIVNTPNLMPF